MATKTEIVKEAGFFDFTNRNARDAVRWLLFGTGVGGAAALISAIGNYMRAQNLEREMLDEERQNDDRLIVEVPAVYEKKASTIWDFLLPASMVVTVPAAYTLGMKFYNNLRKKELEKSIDEEQREYLKAIVASLDPRDLEFLKEKKSSATVESVIKNVMQKNNIPDRPFEGMTFTNAALSALIALSLASAITGGTFTYNALNKEYGKALKNISDLKKKDKETEILQWRQQFRGPKIEIVEKQSSQKIEPEIPAPSQAVPATLLVTTVCNLEKHAAAQAVYPVVNACAAGLHDELAGRVEKDGFNNAFKWADSLPDQNVSGTKLAAAAGISLLSPVVGGIVETLSAASFSDLAGKQAAAFAALGPVVKDIGRDAAAVLMAEQLYQENKTAKNAAVAEIAADEIFALKYYIDKKYADA